MERGKKIEPINREFPLPEPIIQHIQSFLHGKQAAQTSTLSKSWHSAWLTSPNLHLDEHNFQNCGDGSPNPEIEDKFSEFAKKTMRRYEEMNLKISKFRLWMKSTETDRYALASELIGKALKMGVNDLNFEFHPSTETFVLPDFVLAAETLIRLSVGGCAIDRRIDGKVSFSRLKSLSLRRVFIDDDLIWDIVSSCPLMEKLSLSECECLIDIKKSSVARMMTKVSSLRSPRIDMPDKLSEFHNLKSLLLDRIHFDRLFLRDFALKFPSLVNLTLCHCYGDKRMQISSPTLECLSLVQTRMFKAKFDVPSLHKFKFSFSGSSLPNVSFTTVSRECVYDISIKCSCYDLRASWFYKLKNFLTKLSRPEISLSIVFCSEMQICNVGDIQDLPIPVVENLMLYTHSSSSVCFALLDSLFWSCRPKVVKHNWFPRSYVEEKANNDLLELFCKTLIQRVYKDMFGLRDLEEVTVEIYEETLREWQPLPWETLLDASTSPEAKREIRFRLKWKEEPIASCDMRTSN